VPVIVGCVDDGALYAWGSGRDANTIASTAALEQANTTATTRSAKRAGRPPVVRIFATSVPVTCVVN
jgi:hypothetical protein